MVVTEHARAKLNLYLHVTGRRPDGHHELQSLVCFVEFGDQIQASLAKTDSLTIVGPFSDDLTGADNLVSEAAHWLGRGKLAAAIELEKNLPVASGIGGGSADAGATIRALEVLWSVKADTERLVELGADVPVCYKSKAAVMTGIGEKISDPVLLPACCVLLVNAGAPVSTREVFGRVTTFSAPLMQAQPDGRSIDQLVSFLHATRNDLTDAAIETSPVIGEVLDALDRLSGCLLSRMSGSGGTCFALFEDEVTARSAEMDLRSDQPDWWCKAAKILS